MERIILFGGKSVEKDISVITALQAATYYNDAKLIYIDGNTWRYVKGLPVPADFKDREFIDKCKKVYPSLDGALYIKGFFGMKKVIVPDIALICCHGGEGENGSLAGFLNICGIKVINGSVLEQAVCMDKRASKSFFKGLGLPVVEGIVVGKKEFYGDKESVLNRIAESVDLPVVVKPLRGGSSIAVAAAKNIKELCCALETAFEFDLEVIAEREVENFTEINIAVYLGEKGINISRPERPLRAGELLDFKDKYTTFGKGGGKRIFPYETPLEKELQNAAKKVYTELGGEGIMRADFLIEGERWYINEVNAIPGSLAFYLFPEKSFAELIEDTEKVALQAYEQKEKLVCEYDGGIIMQNGKA